MKKILNHPLVRTHATRVMRFGASGAIGSIIDLGSLTLMVEFFDIHPRFGVIFSTFFALIFMFIAHKYFTFQNREQKHGAQAVKFSLVYAVAICYDIGFAYLFLWAGVHYFLAKTFAIAIVAFWNYAMLSYFVFPPSSTGLPVRQAGSSRCRALDAEAGQAPST